MGDFTYVNGIMTPSETASVSALDAGFLYGDGLFETMRVYGGRVFMMPAHLSRLRRGLRVTGIVGAPSVSALAAAIIETVGANRETETVVRITITRGAPGGGPTVVVQTRTAGYREEDYRDGAHCGLVPDTRGGNVGLKSLSCLSNRLAHREAVGRRLVEAIFVDGRGFVTEGTVSNVFAVSAGVLRTPPADGRILRGVTRGVVLEMARAAGLAAGERRVALDELKAADEAFITNSVMEIMPVIALNGDQLGAGVPGPVTKRLAGLYHDRVTANDEAGD